MKRRERGDDAVGLGGGRRKEGDKSVSEKDAQGLGGVRNDGE